MIKTSKYNTETQILLDHLETNPEFYASLAAVSGAESKDHPPVQDEADLLETAVVVRDPEIAFPPKLLEEFNRHNFYFSNVNWIAIAERLNRSYEYEFIVSVTFLITTSDFNEYFARKETAKTFKMMEKEGVENGNFISSSIANFHMTKASERLLERHDKAERSKE